MKNLFTINNIVLLMVLCFLSIAFLYAVYLLLFINAEVGTEYVSILAPMIMVLSIVVLKMPDAVKQYLSILLVSVFVSLYLFEIYSVHSEVSRADRAKALGVPFDPRNPLDFILDERKQGIDVFYAYRPSRLSEKVNWQPSIHPLGYQSDSLVFSNNEGGLYPIYRLDERGFNNPHGVWEGEVKALLVGDSFSFGYGVAQGGDVGSFLRQKGVPTINLGITGNGPLSEYACLVEYLRHVKPEVVYWLFFGNDYVDLQHELMSPVLAQYFASSDYTQKLFYRQAEIDGAAARMARYLQMEDMERYNYEKHAERPLWKMVKLKKTRARILSVVHRLLKDEVPVDRTDFLTILKKAKALSTANNAKFVFVYLPTKNGQPFEREATLAAVKRLGVEIIDFSQEILKGADPDAYRSLRSHAHFNAFGNEKLADELIRNTDLVRGNASTVQ